MNHNTNKKAKICPVCEKNIQAILPTKVYCTDNCRFKFNKLKEKQLKINCPDLSGLLKKNYEILEFGMGVEKNTFRVKIDLLRAKGFQAEKYSEMKHRDGKKIYVIDQYEYFIEGSEIVVKRCGAVKKFQKGIAARWRMHFPEFTHGSQMDAGNLNNAANQETAIPKIKKLEIEHKKDFGKWKFRKYGIWWK